MNLLSIHPKDSETCDSPGSFLRVLIAMPLFLLAPIFIAFGVDAPPDATSISPASDIHRFRVTEMVQMMVHSKINTPPTHLVAPFSNEFQLFLCPENIKVACSSSLDPQVTGTPQFSGFCADVSLAYTDTVISTTCPTIISRNWTLGDACGNESQCAQLITILDNTPPVLIMPETISGQVSCELINIESAIEFSQGNQNNGFLQEASTLFQSLNLIPEGSTDDCGDSFWAESGIEVLVGDCAYQLTLVCYFVATDECGNTSPALFTSITIADDTAPVMIQSVQEFEAVNCDAVPVPIAPAYTDNCDPAPTVALLEEIIPGDCPQSYTIQRVWLASDACGNTASDTLYITVSDNTPPSLLNLPADTIIACGESTNQPLVSVLDNCDPTASLEFYESVIPGICENNYTIIRTWKSKDACGNESKHQQTVQVIDDVAPNILSAPVDLLVTCAEEVPAPLVAIAYDECSGLMRSAGISTTQPGACPNQFVIERTWTFEDACSNVSSISQIITVSDTIAPELTVPAQVEFTCTLGELAEATAVDNCLETPVITFEDIPALDSNGYGLVQRIWTATDACGNVSSESQQISIVDDEAPVVICMDHSIYLDMNGTAEIGLEQFEPGVSDNCGIASLSLSKQEFDCTDIGENVVTLTAVDHAGNYGNCTAVITVQDTISPVALCKNVAVFLNSAGEASVTSAHVDDGSFDNCGVSELMIIAGKSTYSCSDELMNFVLTLSVSDESGNMSTCTSSVQVAISTDEDGDNVGDNCDLCYGDDATGDSDSDGICNDADLCPFYPDLIDGDSCTDLNGNEGVLQDCECHPGPLMVCTSPDACNYWDPENFPGLTEGIDYIISPEICTEPFACYTCQGTEGYGNGTLEINPEDDTNNNGICDNEEPSGCTSSSACNYSPAAAVDNGSCIEPEANCILCISSFPYFIFIDSDGDGVCNAQEIPGCTNVWACNFNPEATQNNGSCTFAEAGCSACMNGQSVPTDTDNDGVPDCEELFGCTNPLACNFNTDASEDNGSCITPEPNCSACAQVLGQWLLIPIDSDNDGICNADELSGCTVIFACNYNPEATNNDNSCIVPVANCTVCADDGLSLLIVDSDFDGICNAQELPGCTNPVACNYNPLATDNNGSCLVPVQGCTLCIGNFLVLQDADNDGICNASEIPGCTDPEAVNYDPAATDENGSCMYVISGCTDPAASNFNPSATENDGNCVYIIAGCTDPNANNFSAVAQTDDGSCNYLNCPNPRTLPYCARFNANNLSGFSQAQSPADHFDWLIQTGSTPSEGTGPESGQGMYGGYLYMEASEPNNPFKKAIVKSPCIDLGESASPALSFSYHMWGSYVGKLFVEITTNGITWEIIWMKQGDQGNQWITEEVSLNDYAGQFIRIRFRGVTSHGWQGDIAIDEICIGTSPETAAIGGYEASTQLLYESLDELTINEKQAPEMDAYQSKDPYMQVYPNPSGSLNNITMRVSGLQIFEPLLYITVQDLSGRVLMQQSLKNDRSAEELLIIPEFDRALPSGLYLLSVTDGVLSITEKIVLSD